MKFFRLRQKRYTSYEDGSASVHPHVEPQARMEWRYEGVGMMADDGIDDFLEDPDQVNDDMLTALLGSEALADDAIEEALASGEEFGPLCGDRETSDENASCKPSAATCASGASDPEIVEPDYVQAQKAEKCDASRISYMYESRDGKLCGFEDDAGHIVAVKAQRLA